MEALTSWKFPFSSNNKEPKQPLQTLSPDRVNNSRPTSAISTTPTKSNGETSSDEPREDIFTSTHSSPTRRAKANLFADYHPTNGTPPKPSFGGGLPQSPSLPEFTALRSHVRTNSDVQGLVKRFEHLDVRDKDAESARTRKRLEADLSRATVAREEAESDAKRLREEVRGLEGEVEVGRERERMGEKRLGVVAEEYERSKEAHAAQKHVYDKELRKAQKEAYKSSSMIVNLQGELKATTVSLQKVQRDLDLEKRKTHKKEQERFEMEYQLIPLQEQVEKLTQKLKVADAENEALKTNLREEEVARIAAEGMIALPNSNDQDTSLLSSPQKRVRSPLSDDKENMPAVAKKIIESKRLTDELERERTKRAQAEELAEFLRMECLFRCCPCKTAERFGHDLALTLDVELAAGVEKIRKGMEEILTPPKTPVEVEVDAMDLEPSMKVEQVLEVTGQDETKAEFEDATVLQAPETQTVKQLDRSMTMEAEPPLEEASPENQLQEEAQRALDIGSPKQIEVLAEQQTTSVDTTRTIPLQPSSPITPTYQQQQQHQTTPFRAQTSIRTVTTTTTVPMHFTPISKPPALFKLTDRVDAEDIENIPPHAKHNQPTQAQNGETAVLTTPTFDRAAALAAIEYRRGRAKSIANGQGTPRKQMIEGVGGVGGRRDISAPALGQRGGGGTGSVKARSGSAGRGVGVGVGRKT